MEGVSRRNGLYGFEFLEEDQRRVPERKRYEVKALWQRQHEIINLAARGMKQTEIADILNITPACVSDTLNSQLGQMKLSEIRKARDDDAKKFNEKIRVLTNKALNKYHEIFDNEDGNATVEQQRRVADTVLLELSGLRAPTRVQSESISYRLTPEEFREFLKRGTKACEDAGKPIQIPEELKEIQ